MRFQRVIVVAVLLGLAPLHARAEELGVGDAAPKLTVKEFIKGKAVRQFERGKIYVVEFWATWCPPCRQTIPHLTKLQKKYPDVTVIGVSVSEPDPAKVKPFVEEMGDKMDYRVATDREDAMAKSWMQAAGLDGIPTVFIVDGDGKIAWIGHPMAMDKPLEKIRAGQWDLKAAAAEFAEARKEKARRAAEAAKAEKERVQRLIAQLPEAEQAAAKAVEKWGGKVTLDDGGESVTVVDLGGTRVTDAGLKELKGLKGLQVLGLVGCEGVTDAGLKELRGLKKLQTLFLGRTRVTDVGLKELGGLTELRRLGLSHTRVTDAGLKELKGLKALRQLILVETKVTAAGVADLEKALPELQIVTGDSASGAVKKQRDLYLLGIGQQDDWDFLPLGFESVLREQGKAFYGHMHSRLLLGREATRKEFLDGLAWLRRHATADDLVVVFIACHGNCVAGESVFSTRDGDVRPRDIKKELAQLPCQAIVINDACQSGNWPQERPDDPMPPNVTALCCCLATQNSAFEFDITLFEALWGRADFNKDGVVDLDEVIRYCGLRIKEVQGGRLTPVLHKAKDLKDAPPLTKVAPNLVGVVHEGAVWSALLGRQDGDRYHVRIIGSPIHPGPHFLTHWVPRDSLYLPGDGPALMVKRKDGWCPARMLSRDGGRYTIRYLGARKGEEVVEEQQVRHLFAGKPGEVFPLDGPAPRAVQAQGIQFGQLDAQQITELSMNDKQTTDAALKVLKGFKELRVLNLVGCSRVTDAGLKELKELKRLRTLFLGGT